MSDGGRGGAETFGNAKKAKLKRKPSQNGAKRNPTSDEGGGARTFGNAERSRKGKTPYRARAARDDERNDFPVGGR